MDVRCVTCDEPWDTDHLRFDEVHETNLSSEEAKAWTKLPRAQQMTNEYRALFRLNGWEFGSSVISVIRCPACPKDAKADPERLAMKSVLEDLLGDDEDGIAAMMEDYGL